VHFICYKTLLAEEKSYVFIVTILTQMNRQSEESGEIDKSSITT